MIAFWIKSFTSNLKGETKLNSFRKVWSLKFVLISFAFLIATNGSAQTRFSSDEYFRSIEVLGTADMEVAPDIASFTVTYSKEATSSKAAIEDLNNSVLNLVNSLSEFDEQDIEIQLAAHQIIPSYDGVIWDKFTARQQILVQVLDIELLGEVIDAVAAAEPSSTGAIEFESTNLNEFEQEVLENASNDARLQAENILQNTGGILGTPLEIDYIANQPMQNMDYLEDKGVMSANASRKVSLDARKITISAQVRVIYEILSQ